MVAANGTARRVQMADSTMLRTAGSTTLDITQTLDAGGVATFVGLEGDNAQLHVGFGESSIAPRQTDWGDVVGTTASTVNVFGDLAVGQFIDHGAPDILRKFVKQCPGTLALPAGEGDAPYTTLRIEGGTVAVAGWCEAELGFAELPPLWTDWTDP